MTPYQIRLLTLASAGLSNKEIGIEVGGLSERTVKNHFTILYRQMETKKHPHINRTLACILAMSRGIIEKVE